MMRNADGTSGLRSVAGFVVLTYAVTWVLLLPGVLPSPVVGESVVLGLYVAGAFGPSIAAVAVVARENGRAGVRSLLSRVTRWRVGRRWYLAALAVPVGLKLGAVGVLVAVGYPAPSLPAGGALALVLAIAVVGGLVPGAIGEELGWRGFALPRLQSHFEALPASLVLGVVWAAWHLPTFLLPFTGQASLPMAPLLVEIVGASVLYAWLLNNTDGSVLLAILFHAANNALTPVVLPGVIAAGYVGVYGVASAVAVWLGAGVVVLATGRATLSRSGRVATWDR